MWEERREMREKSVWKRKQIEKWMEHYASIAGKRRNKVVFKLEKREVSKKVKTKSYGAVKCLTKV